MECEISSYVDITMLTLSVRFRWVACQLDSLRDCFDLLHLRQALKSLPKTLDDTYARILCNIDDHYNHYNRQILKILQWLTFSLRPLELKEIAEVFAIEVDQTPRFDPQRRMPEPRDMLTMCSSLITVTNNMHNTPEEEESGSKPNVGFQDPDGDCEANNSVSEDVETYVRLAHFSVKEYLLSDRIQHGAASYYSIREMKSHGVLAEDCIAYLLQFDEPGSLTSVTLGLSPLAQYAAMSWRRHARFAEEGLIKSTTLLAMELFMAEGEAFLNWIRIYNGVLDEQPENPGTPLYYASEGELFEPVRMLIEGGLDVNAKGGEAGNALTAASFSENIDIVHLLIINGADVNAQGGLLGNALQAGADADADNVVELLLKHGAEVNVVSGNYNTPLIAAISYGNENVVKLLLEKGADVKAGRYGSAVVSASKNGHENVVKLLLDKGADVNAPGDGLRALYAASVNGYENIVNLLLENGAEINDTSEYSGNALQAASANGHENIVKLLLEKKADVNALGYNLWEDARGYDSWGSALEAASYNGDENIVKLLLKEGADVNAVGDRLCGSALQAASDNGNENVVKMLLKKGADVNALGYYLWGNALPYYSWGTALQVASDNGYENIVKMLLEEGADVNVLGDGVLGSALYLASEQGHESIVKMLEAKGAVIVLPTEKRSEDEPKSEYSPAEHIEEPDPVEDLPAHSDASPALE